MSQKLIVGVLVLIIVVAVVATIYDHSKNSDEAESSMLSDEAAAATEAPTITEEVPVTEEAIATEAVSATDEPLANEVVQPKETASAEMPDTEQTATAEAPIQVETSMGVPWVSTGTIVGADEVGLTIRQNDGTEVYVELAPPMYQESIGVNLAVDDNITIMGFNNEGQIHTQFLTKADGTQYQFRNEAGMPLWSGGVDQVNATGTHEPINTMDTWITLKATVITTANNGFTARAEDGTIIDAKLGQPTFWNEQGVTFAVGDEITMLGFWQGDTFNPGVVTKDATGEILRLRDPNGRPLWAGRGQGQGNGGNGNQGQGQGQGNN